MVEDTSSDDGNSLLSPTTHDKYAGLLAIAGDEREDWSDDDTITIGYSQNEIAQILDIATLPAESNAQIKDQFGRYATLFKYDGSFQANQDIGYKSQLFESRLKPMGLQRYLAEDPAEGLWTVFHLRVKYAPLTT